jgi:ribosomal protein S18 acetylase RimI-like enzyme
VAEIVLREFRFADDYGPARGLWETAGTGIHVRRADEPAEIQKKLERDPDLFLVAEADGRLVGTVIGGFDGRRGLVYHLAVEAGLRGQGIGQRLMDELERRLRLKGCLKSYLLVTTENDEAMHFYEKRGWSRMDMVYIYAKDL